VGPRTGLDDMERRKILPLPGLELRPLGRPVSSQLLYRLSYPGPLCWKYDLEHKFTSELSSDVISVLFNTSNEYLRKFGISQ
jgi:hypothetical protein